jgi:hypothetical protein
MADVEILRMLRGLITLPILNVYVYRRREDLRVEHEDAACGTLMTST